MSKIVQDSNAHLPPLQQFLNTIPSPLTIALISLGPYISRIRHVSEIVSWKSSWEESWLAIALWWAACLLGDVALRYILPLAMLLVLFVARWTTKQQAPDTPITEDTLQQSIADLLTIHALLPRLPSTPSTPNFLPVLLRASAILYIPYLILTHLVKLRVLIALSGTVVLTWRARWAGLIRRGLWRSAYIRWGTYRLWAFLSGQPLPPPTLSPQSQLVFTSFSSLSSPTSPTSASSTNLESKDPKVGKEPIVNSFRFLFTVHENQRWWMGLDFSAALLPNERPSWSSTSHQAVAPPSMFSLPSPTTIYMNQPSSQGGGKHVQIRVKRMARWKWEEPEWKVVVHRDGASGISRVERPIPSPESENSGSTGPANRILKAAGKMRQASLSGGAAHTRAASGASIGTGVGREGSPERHRDDVFSGDGVNGNSGGKEQGLENVFTDVDGWIYGDNKWENCSSENGMGKYTRHRRWTRIAILSETVEPAEEGETGIRKDAPSSSVPSPISIDSNSSNTPPTPLHSAVPPTPAQSKSTGSPQTKDDNLAGPSSSAYELSPITPTSSGGDDAGSKLRMRLQAAVKGSGHS